MSDSVRLHRRPPTRLPRPWDSPGKSTGVGCHFLLQCMKVESESEVAQSCPTPSDPMDCSPPGPSVHGIFQARLLEWGTIAFSGKQRLTCLDSCSRKFLPREIGLRGMNNFTAYLRICLPSSVSGQIIHRNSSPIKITAW